MNQKKYYPHLVLLVVSAAVIWILNYVMSRETAAPPAPKAVEQEAVEPVTTPPEVQVSKVKNGWVREYWPNGKLKSEKYYVNDVLNGQASFFDQEGHLISTMSYLDGVPEGELSQLFDDGSRKTEGTYKNGRLNGPYKRYNKNGSPSMEAVYVSGLIQGERRDYYPDGTLKRVEHFEKGERTGDSMEYFASGKPHYENHYTDGVYNGVNKQYFPEGGVKSEETYDNGVIKNRKMYDRQGNVIYNLNF